ncbi:OmpA family protein [Dactylosporangium vinaceum]|uniref:OmpA family protein n=1 Tax=Dactylosporangium vinaceum TaxID=53362 RepID=UPI001CA8D656|nr:OmpA family protein [Dactylosporangium vinaceum]
MPPTRNRLDPVCRSSLPTTVLYRHVCTPSNGEPTVRRLLPLTVALLVVLTACTRGPQADGHAAAAASSPSADSGTTTAPSPAPPDDAGSLAPGQQPGLDDYNDDRTPDPLCGAQDFGGGLTLRIPCTITTAHEPEEGTRLVKDSLYRLPGVNIDLEGISGEMIFARAAGTDERVFVMIFNSDNLFATGSAALTDPDQIAKTISVINAKLSDGVIQVRGHTDSTGTASGNQTLSASRATTVQHYLTTHGVKATAVSAVGLGSTRPLVEETNPDGSVSVKGRAFNRRVEIVVRLPKS